MVMASAKAMVRHTSFSVQGAGCGPGAGLFHAMRAATEDADRQRGEKQHRPGQSTHAVECRCYHAAFPGHAEATSVRQQLVGVRQAPVERRQAKQQRHRHADQNLAVQDHATCLAQRQGGQQQRAKKNHIVVFRQDRGRDGYAEQHIGRQRSPLHQFDERKKQHH